LGVPWGFTQVNGTTVLPAAGIATWKNHRLTLLPSILKAGAPNTIKVAYENDYDHTGEGLHTFKDPEDSQVYVYSNFEPFEAHRMLPCFDQPDLKGRLAFIATAPETWEVVANAALLSKDPIEVLTCTQAPF
jgi:aminopeptidase N